MFTRLLSLRPGDVLTIAFSLFLLGLTAVSHAKIPMSGNLLLIYASLLFFQIVLVFISGRNSFLLLTRDLLFPVLCVLIIFDTLGLIVHPINPHDWDYRLIRLDYLLFGGYPTVMVERLIHPVLTDILQVAYSTYYFLPVALGVTLKLRGQREEFEYALFLILLCFYLSYVGYLLVPALGPRYAMEHLHAGEVGGFLVAEPIQNFLNLLEGVKRDAFPSGHTGIALTVLYLSYRSARDLFRLLLVPVLLLIIATVYCRYHYAVDVLAGGLLTVVTVASGGVYYKFWKQKQRDQEDALPCRRR
ncbi:MAG: phosphatase PAP2 family protein [Nitrospirales bacterium]|nr:phosphatase PAP2 family protein [Nitrospirales bacterium]